MKAKFSLNYELTLKNSFRALKPDFYLQKSAS